MKKLILASAATLMLGGIAIAQEAPATIYGNGSASAERASGTSIKSQEAGDLDFGGIDFLPTASIGGNGSADSRSNASGIVTLDDVTNPSANDNISGK